MTQIIPFQFQSITIRAVQIDGAPWFVGKDIAEALGYADTVNALKQHAKGVAKHHPILDALGRTQQVRIISEPDMYRLVAGSRLPEAEKFERWVFEDVLPTIRKTGGYGWPTDAMAVLSDPAAMRGLLLTYTEKVIELQHTVEEQAPKAAFHDQVVQSDHNHELGEAAKLIGTGRTRLARWMREHRWINRHGEPYQDKIEAGLLDLKYSRPWTHPEKGQMRSVTTMVTGKGLAKLQRLLSAATPDMFTGPVLA